LGIKNNSCWLNVLWFWGGLMEFELRFLWLWGRLLSQASSPFCSGYFRNKVSVFKASHHCWDDSYVPPYPAFFLWDGVSHFFAQANLASLSYWPQPPTHLGMTGIYHCTQQLVEMGCCQVFSWAGLKPQSSQISAFQVVRRTGMSQQHPAVL
jgi:hypothetical protein